MIKKSISVLFLRVFGAVMFFLTSLFLTNNFSLQEVGEYDFTRSIIILLSGLCVLGMNDSILYYSGYLKSKKSLIALKGIYLKMLLVIICVSLSIFIFYQLISKVFLNKFLDEKAQLLIYNITFFVPFYSITTLNIEVLRAIDKIYFSEVFRNVFRFLFFLIAIVFLSRNNIINSVPNLFLWNFLVTAIFSTVIVFSKFKSLKYRKLENTIGVKEIVKRSYPMSISVISLLIMQSIDIIIIEKYMDYRDVAIYAVSVKITSAIALVLASVNTVISTKISEYFSLNQTEELKKVLQSGARLIFVLTSPIIILLFFFSEEILSFFGDSYIDSKSSLQILLIGQIINVFCGSIGVYMNMTNKQKILQRILIIACLINIFLNSIFIPKMGIKGAAFSTAFSISFWNIIAVIYVLKKDKVKTFLS
jgi:O-antigen/teichoic acid export membrane protein